MVELMDSNVNGERFILNSENVAVRELLCMIADELKVKRPVYKVTQTMGELAWRFEYLRSAIARQQPRFSKVDMSIAGIPFRYSNAKIIQTTGHSFRTIAQSVHDTAQSFLESKNKGMSYAVFE
jgi:dihydroflavonol-4-reductase